MARWWPGARASRGDTSILFNVGQSTVPVGLNGVTAIAAGGWSSVALVGPPRLTPPERQPDGSTQLLLSGITGWTYTVDVSSDLVNWTPLGSFVSTNSVTPTPGRRGQQLQPPP